MKPTKTGMGYMQPTKCRVGDNRVMKTPGCSWITQLTQFTRVWNLRGTYRRILYPLSEKLAFAFGLVSTSVIKNQPVCNELWACSKLSFEKYWNELINESIIGHVVDFA